MKILFSTSLLLLIIFSIIGCSSISREDILKEDIKIDNNISTQSKRDKPAIQTIEVSRDNFDIETPVIPDMETIKRIKILGAQLDDVIALLTEATNQNIVYQLQPENFSGGNQNTQNRLANSAVAGGLRNNTNNYADIGINSSADEIQMRESKIYLSASNIGVGRVLKKALGDKLSINYSDETYYIGAAKTVTLKIPSLKGLSKILTETIENIGGLNVSHDSITSSITFTAHEKNYQDIMKYLTVLRNNLYVIEYEIAIYNVDLKDDYSLGIDWNLLATRNNGVSLASSTSSAFGAASIPASFGAILNTDNLTGLITGEALSQFGKVESIQKPKLLGIAGTDVVLVDGLEEPYIKELKTTAVGDNGIQTSTVSASALSGLKVTLNSNVMDGTVITDISLEINDIVGYSNFEVDGVSYAQPRTQTKNITNSMRVQPGVPIVISGLFRNKSDKGYKGIPGIANTRLKLLGGSEYDSGTKSEMVIIVTPRIIKYVMK